MKEHPIPFSPPMVRAILGDRKTQTRRVIRPQPVPSDAAFEIRHKRENVWGAWLLGARGARHVGWCNSEWRCPYGQPGDRLWVRETWWHEKGGDYENAGFADGTLRSKQGDVWHLPDWHPKDAQIWRKRPSIHMPRWASRINLEVLAVRVEHVQDISEADAVAEGVANDAYIDHDAPIDELALIEVTGDGDDRHIEAFADLWDAINAKRGFGWEANPWVWVVTFRLLTKEGEQND